MKVNWLKDADAALTEAKTNKKPLLIDFSSRRVARTVSPKISCNPVIG